MQRANLCSSLAKRLRACSLSPPERSLFRAGIRWGHREPIVEEGPGEFLAEVGQLSGQRALVDAHAVTDVEALLIPPDKLRNLVIVEADIGDKIMRALILRRIALIEMGSGGPVLIGPAESPDMVRLQGFLSRNGYPHQVVDPSEDPEAAALIDRYVSGPNELPLAVCPNGTVLKNPSEGELAQCSAWREPICHTGPMTWPLSARAPRGSQPRFMERLKDCR